MNGINTRRVRGSFPALAAALALCACGGVRSLAVQGASVKARPSDVSIGYPGDGEDNPLPETKAWILQKNEEFRICGTVAEVKGGEYDYLGVFEGGNIHYGVFAKDLDIPLGASTLPCAADSFRLWPDGALRSAVLRETATISSAGRGVAVSQGLVSFSRGGNLDSFVPAREAELPTGSSVQAFEAGKRVYLWDTGSVRYGDPAKPRGPGVNAKLPLAKPLAADRLNDAFSVDEYSNFAFDREGWMRKAFVMLDADVRTDGADQAKRGKVPVRLDFDQTGRVLSGTVDGPCWASMIRDELVLPADKYGDFALFGEEYNDASGAFKPPARIAIDLATKVETIRF
jgi:hypothetical protein